MITNNKNILYLASHGFAVRMLIQTNLLGKLKTRGYNVGVVTSDAQDPSVKAYCIEHGITNIEFRDKPALFQSNIELFRKYILEDVKGNPALYEKHLRLRDQASKRLSVKWKYYTCNMLYAIVKKFPFIRSLYLKIESRLLNAKEAAKLIDSYQPAAVISTYPVSTVEAKILECASKAGLKTITHLLSWDNISCKGHFRKVTDEFIVWGEIMKNELIRYYGIDPALIHETGVPHFDVHARNKQAGNTAVNGTNSKGYLFFAMSSPYFAPREIDIVEKIAQWVEEDAFPGVDFIVRPHPQNVIGNMADLNWLPRLQRLESKRVKVNYPGLNERSGINWSMKLDDMQGMSDLIGGASIVLNSCSTMTIDGLSHEKPVIITAFDNEEQLPWHISVKRVMEYEHFKNIVESGGVTVSSNYGELKNGISRYLADPLFDLGKRKEILFREIGQNDGMATDRVVAAIVQIIDPVVVTETSIQVPVNS